MVINVHDDIFVALFNQFFYWKVYLQTLSHEGVSEVEEDTQPITEEQPNKSTSKKRKGEKQIQDSTKKKKRKKTVKVMHTQT